MELAVPLKKSYKVAVEDMLNPHPMSMLKQPTRYYGERGQRYLCVTLEIMHHVHQSVATADDSSGIHGIHDIVSPEFTEKAIRMMGVLNGKALGTKYGPINGKKYGPINGKIVGTKYGPINIRVNNRKVPLESLHTNASKARAQFKGNTQRRRNSLLESMNLSIQEQQKRALANMTLGKRQCIVRVLRNVNAQYGKKKRFLFQANNVAYSVTWSFFDSATLKFWEAVEKLHAEATANSEKVIPLLLEKTMEYLKEEYVFIKVSKQGILDDNFLDTNKKKYAFVGMVREKIVDCCQYQNCRHRREKAKGRIYCALHPPPTPLL